jgi:hypothetical protein
MKFYVMVSGRPGEKVGQTEERIMRKSHRVARIVVLFGIALSAPPFAKSPPDLTPNLASSWYWAQADFALVEVAAVADTGMVTVKVVSQFSGKPWQSPIQFPIDRMEFPRRKREAAM